MSTHDIVITIELSKTKSRAINNPQIFSKQCKRRHTNNDNRRLQILYGCWQPQEFFIYF